jgi:hypothetical protein
MRRNPMAQRLTAVGLLALAMAMAMPVQDAKAQDILGGALFGGAAGGLIGGAVGGRGGIIPGVIIGAAAGAIIASEGERRRGGYYYHRNGCYRQRADGAWVAMSPRYCEGPAEYGGAAPSDAVAYCMQRFRSYDPASQTYVGYDGYRRSCP